MASVRKLPNGKYQAQFRPVPGGKQITKTSARRATVQAWLDNQVAAQVTGTFTHPKDGKTTLGSFYAEWSARQVWESNTRRSQDLIIKYLPFVDEPLGKITRARIEQWVKAMQVMDRGDGPDGMPQRGFSPGTIRSRFMAVRGVMRAAIADRKIIHDPTLNVRLPSARRKEAAMAIPAPEQVLEILTAASPAYRPLYALAAFAGLRLGEASAIKVGDIGLRTIKVQRQAVRGPHGIEVRLPKYGSERTVAAADGLLRMLAAHITAMGLEGQHDAWMFSSGRGGPAIDTTIGTNFQEARGDLPFTLHDFRHFYASGLIAAGCDVSTVQHALGHSSPSTTLNTYTHLWPNSEDRTRAGAQGLIASVFGHADELLTNDTAASQ